MSGPAATLALVWLVLLVVLLVQGVRGRGWARSPVWSAAHLALLLLLLAEVAG